VIDNEVGIYNLALNAIGARSNVTSPAENSREAEVCNLWFSPVRDQVLASASWPEATNMKYLAILKEADEDGDGIWALGDPRPGYQFVYSLPSDCLRPQYLSDFSRFLVTYYEPNQRAFHTNTVDAIFFYTMRLETISLWSSELQMAIVYALAANICMPLSGKPARAKMLADKANQLVLMARETAANTSNERYESIPDWISARGYSDGSSQTRFFYPYGSLLSVS
jgi:hypothetical protein